MRVIRCHDENVHELIIIIAEYRRCRRAEDIASYATSTQMRVRENNRHES
jgi:hypothetical protein